MQEEVKNLSPNGEAKISELMNSYERKGMEKGKVEGKQESICGFLKTKFGPNADSLQEHVRTMNDSKLLDDV